MTSPRPLLSLHPHCYELSFILLILAILTWVRRNFEIVFICISFMAKDIEHFIKCFLAQPFLLQPLRTLC